MAYVDRNQVERVLKIISSKDSRTLLSMLNKYPLKHTEISKNLEKSSNISSYHIRRLKNSKMIKVDKGYYFLTRVGIETVKLLKAFETVCLTFDLSDASADGIIKSIVVRHK